MPEPTLPPGLIPYKRTPVFTETTIPAGLRRRHRTKAGVWGVISVLAGGLRLHRLDDGSETLVGSGETAIVAPEEPHEVDPAGPVRFFVEFHAARP